MNFSNIYSAFYGRFVFIYNDVSFHLDTSFVKNRAHKKKRGKLNPLSKAGYVRRSFCDRGRERDILVGASVYDNGGEPDFDCFTYKGL